MSRKPQRLSKNMLNFYKNKCERENTGAMAKPLENWERLLATCEREWN